jgi:hypothetical protein
MEIQPRLPSTVEVTSSRGAPAGDAPTPSGGNLPLLIGSKSANQMIVFDLPTKQTELYVLLLTRLRHVKSDSLPPFSERVDPLRRRTHECQGTHWSVSLTPFSFLRSSASGRRDRSLESTSSSRLLVASAACNNYKLTLKQKDDMLKDRKYRSLPGPDFWGSEYFYISV